MFIRIRTYLFSLFLKYAPRKLQIYYYRKAVLVPAGELYRKYTEVLRLLENKGKIGDYLEFGVFRGASLLSMFKALEKMKVKNVRLFGFDSFDGLPDSKNRYDEVLPWLPGSYKSSLEETSRILDKANIDWKRVFLVKGWYSDTLNTKTLKKYKLAKASLIMIDCDLYSSAKQALDFCLPLIKDKAYIFFDDWDSGHNLAGKNQGEKQAFDEFLEANPEFKAEDYGSYYHKEMKNSPESKIFRVTRHTKDHVVIN